MKRGVLFILLMMSIATLKAQWSVTPEIGVAAAKRVEMGSLSYDWASTWRLGVGAEYALNKRVSLKSGLYYMQRGGYSISYLFGPYGVPSYGGGYFYEGGYSYPDGYYQTGAGYMPAKTNRHFLQLPLMAKYAWQLREEVKVNVSAGPYIAYCIGNSSGWMDVPPTGCGGDCGGDYPGGYRHAYVSRAGGMPPFNWGFSGSVGLEVKNWVLNLVCDLSLGDETWRKGAYVNHHPAIVSAVQKFDLSLCVGYKFNLGK